MSRVKKYIPWLVLLLLIFCANWFTESAERVEKWYVGLFYRQLSNSVRILVGWLSFSLGDLLYTILIFIAFLKIIQWITTTYKCEDKLGRLKKGVLAFLFWGGWLWLIFNFIWGFNYYRESISVKFDLPIQKNPSQQDLEKLTKYLLGETNKFSAGRTHLPFNEKINRLETQRAYDHLSGVYPSLTYKHVSFKSSLFGEIGNYMGYSGYYNPLTGEAQINSHMPVFTLPFTSVHEVAHQLGFAKESEANFIGYLAAIHSSDSSLRYAANLEMFLYAAGSLTRLDSTIAHNMMDSLSDIAKNDLKEYDAFVKKYQGPVDHATTWFYSRFLKLNNQPEGMRSYSRVTLWLLAYFKKQKLL